MGFVELGTPIGLVLQVGLARFHEGNSIWAKIICACPSIQVNDNRDYGFVMDNVFITIATERVAYANIIKTPTESLSSRLKHYCDQFTQLSVYSLLGDKLNISPSLEHFKRTTANLFLLPQQPLRQRASSAVFKILLLLDRPGPKTQEI